MFTITRTKKNSKTDLSVAYQQIKLTNESRKLVTIFTHKGLFSYTRLPYGITCAPVIFQNIMEHLFTMPEVLSFLDDIIVTGKTDALHIQRLEKVFCNFQECGLKVKRGKCNLFQDSVHYLEYGIGQRGLHTMDERVSAINGCKMPKNVTELISFLGMVNYYCKFIKNVFTILKPLYDLLKKNVK